MKILFIKIICAIALFSSYQFSVYAENKGNPNGRVVINEKVDLYKKNKRGGIYLITNKQNAKYGESFYDSILCHIIRENRHRVADEVRKFLERGADSNIPCYNGMTPLDLAREMQNQEVMDLLLEYGVDQDHESLVVTGWLLNVIELKLSNFKNGELNKENLDFDTLDIDEEIKEELLNKKVIYSIMNFKENQRERAFLLYTTPLKFDEPQKVQKIK